MSMISVNGVFMYNIYIKIAYETLLLVLYQNCMCIKYHVANLFFLTLAEDRFEMRGVLHKLEPYLLLEYIPRDYFYLMSAHTRLAPQPPAPPDFACLCCILCESSFDIRFPTPEQKRPQTTLCIPAPRLCVLVLHSL